MRRQNNGQSFLNLTQIGKYLGWGRDTVRKTFAGVEYYQSGKEKLFHVLDITKRLEESRSIDTYG
ncbi:MAG: hypothetical protein LBB94_03925 [Clostridiales bacterium]|jgi:hypothetical protein|nr:hypothetical protein [Clostridiales bacterium]